jgi:hypothetical protein
MAFTLHLFHFCYTLLDDAMQAICWKTFIAEARDGECCSAEGTDELWEEMQGD